MKFIFTQAYCHACIRAHGLSSRLSRQDSFMCTWVAAQKKFQVGIEITYNDIMVELRCKKDCSYFYHNNVVFGTLAKSRYESSFFAPVPWCEGQPIPVVAIWSTSVMYGYHQLQCLNVQMLVFVTIRTCSNCEELIPPYMLKIFLIAKITMSWELPQPYDIWHIRKFVLSALPYLNVNIFHSHFFIRLMCQGLCGGLEYHDSIHLITHFGIKHPWFSLRPSWPKSSLNTWSLRVSSAQVLWS